MNVTIDLQNASGLRSVPPRRQFRHWATAAMSSVAPDRLRSRLSIRIVGEAESAELNARYRHKEGPTNILSFPVPPGLPDTLLGDLAICAPVVEREAIAQRKEADAHWAHLTVHGVLHLNGYDHEEKTMARIMEGLEKSILEKLGYKDPYL